MDPKKNSTDVRATETSKKTLDRPKGFGMLRIPLGFYNYSDIEKSRCEARFRKLPETLALLSHKDIEIVKKAADELDIAPEDMRISQFVPQLIERLQEQGLPKVAKDAIIRQIGFCAWYSECDISAAIPFLEREIMGHGVHKVEFPLGCSTKAEFALGRAVVNPISRKQALDTIIRLIRHPNQKISLRGLVCAGEANVCKEAEVGILVPEILMKLTPENALLDDQWGGSIANVARGPLYWILKDASDDTKAITVRFISENVGSECSSEDARIKCKELLCGKQLLKVRSIEELERYLSRQMTINGCRISVLEEYVNILDFLDGKETTYQGVHNPKPEFDRRYTGF